jgi:hypothetical protein
MFYELTLRRDGDAADFVKPARTPTSEAYSDMT